VDAAGSRQPNDDRENISPPVDNRAAQGQPQDLQYVDMGYYGMANDFPPPQGHCDQIIGDNAGIVHGVPAEDQTAPLVAPAPVCRFLACIYLTITFTKGD